MVESMDGEVGHYINTRDGRVHYRDEDERIKNRPVGEMKPPLRDERDVEIHVPHHIIA